MKDTEVSGGQTVADPEEALRRLAHVYALLLRLAGQCKTADRGEFGDQTRTAADDTPAVEPEAHDAL